MQEQREGDRERNFCVLSLNKLSDREQGELYCAYVLLWENLFGSITIKKQMKKSPSVHKYDPCDAANITVICQMIPSAQMEILPWADWAHVQI